MTNFLNTEHTNSATHNPSQSVGHVGTTLDVRNAFDDRVIELFDIAEDEGRSIDHQSLSDFRKFVNSLRFIKLGHLFLLGNGQLNLVWTDHGVSGRVSIVFLGNELARFRIIRRWGDRQKSRFSGTDSLRRLMQHIEASQLQDLIVP